MPGEIEERNRRHNLANGIDVDDTTWQTLTATANELGLDAAEAQAIVI